MYLQVRSSVAGLSDLQHVHVDVDVDVAFR